MKPYPSVQTNDAYGTMTCCIYNHAATGCARDSRIQRKEQWYDTLTSTLLQLGRVVAC